MTFQVLGFFILKNSKKPRFLIMGLDSLGLNIPISSGGARPLFMAGHRQVISRICEGSQNILIYNFIVTTFDCHGGSQGGGISARAFALAHPGVAPPLPISLPKR